MGNGLKSPFHSKLHIGCCWHNDNWRFVGDGVVTDAGESRKVLIEKVLNAMKHDVSVLYLIGPYGIGKSSLFYRAWKTHNQDSPANNILLDLHNRQTKYVPLSDCLFARLIAKGLSDYWIVTGGETRIREASDDLDEIRDTADWSKILDLAFKYLPEGMRLVVLLGVSSTQRKAQLHALSHIARTRKCKVNLILEMRRATPLSLLNLSPPENQLWSTDAMGATHAIPTMIEKWRPNELEPEEVKSLTEDDTKALCQGGDPSSESFRRPYFSWDDVGVDAIFRRWAGTHPLVLHMLCCLADEHCRSQDHLTDLLEILEYCVGNYPDLVKPHIEALLDSLINEHRSTLRGLVKGKSVEDVYVEALKGYGLIYQEESETPRAIELFERLLPKILLRRSEMIESFVVAAVTSIGVWLWPLYSQAASSAGQAFGTPVGEALGAGMANLIRELFGYAEEHEADSLTENPDTHRDVLTEIISRTIEVSEGGTDLVRKVFEEIEPALIRLLDSPNFDWGEIVSIAAVMPYPELANADATQRSILIPRFVRKMGAERKLSKLMDEIYRRKSHLFSP